MEFNEGKNVSVSLDDVITNDKYSLGPKEDAKSEYFSLLGETISNYAITQSGWIQTLNTTVPGWIMHESSNKVISTCRRRIHSHAERNLVNIRHLSKSWAFLFQLQPVLYLDKCMFVFDALTAGCFTGPLKTGIALEKKKNHSAG